MVKKYNREESISSFWQKVSLSDESNCWEWIGAKHQQGYGLFRWQGKVTRTHRLSYELYHGKCDSKLQVCHKCDNPSCVNPHHLFQGTNLDNSLDRKNKGRSKALRGEEAPWRKLCLKDVEDILNLLNQGESLRTVSKKFDVSHVHVARIRDKKVWK